MTESGKYGESEQGSNELSEDTPVIVEMRIVDRYGNCGYGCSELQPNSDNIDVEEIAESFTQDEVNWADMLRCIWDEALENYLSVLRSE
jgi:hypothetical protein